MNRRHFAKSVMGGLGLSVLAGTAAQATAANHTKQAFEAGHEMRSAEGLNMTLHSHELPTRGRDRQQFILTFEVHNNTQPLAEKIYQLTDHRGQKHLLYMTPVDQQRLQAVFNWRTHA
ncbi:DUF6916 family protein [Marinicella meishanensis]|uniref:DUF6916 family protein n=1 Tax=Marinicella meishanensis TaxID=2873263 RepID=UPI001CBB628D|nr:hypothetical protein [Marinicella sp. NBU2979]